MKKLLTILGVIGIGVAPVMTVIACGGNTDDKKNDDNDKVIDDNNNGINLDAEKILEIILGDGDDIVSSGDENATIQNFLKTFDYAFLQQLSKQDDKTSPAINSPYANPELVETMKKAYEDFQNDVNSQWKDKVQSLEETHKKDQAKMIEDLEKEFDRKLKTVEEYKPFFTYKKATTENNLNDALNKILFQDFAKGTGNLKSAMAMNEVKSNIFLKEVPLKNFLINFPGTAKSLSKEDLDSDTDGKKRENSWYGQFDKWLEAIKTLSSATDAADKELFNLQLGYLINLLNSTGGMELESFIANNKNNSPMTNDDVVWATPKEVENIYNGDIKEWSNKLLKRVDRDFALHFGTGITSGTTISTQDLNGAGPTDLGIPYIELFNTIPDVMQSTTILPGTDNQLAGLASNSKRYLINKYYEEKKPVAITEFVVAPFNSDANITTLDKEVTSKPYINAADLKYQGLYNFIKVFVNNKIDSTNASSEPSPEDHTNIMFEGQSNFSWDVLLKSKGKLENINEGDEWKLENIWHKFDEQLTEQNHQLLTIDNSSQDDETLKYMVYDFLQSDSKDEYKDWGTDKREADYPGDFKISDLPEDRQKYAQSIAALVHSMDRSGEKNAAEKSENNVYQVLNAEQGILSYVDGKGIHFVRIEGYPLLKKDNEADLRREQTKLTIDTEQDMLKNYATYYQVQENLNGKDSIVKNNTALITTDYLSRNQTAKNFTKVSYNDLNKSFGNKYLEFLFNASLANIIDQGSGLAKYTFNLNNDVTSWAASAPSDDKYWTAQWEYIRQIFGYKDDAEMFDTFFKEPTDKNKIGTDIFNKYRSFVLGRLSNPVWGKRSTQKMATQWMEYEDKYKNRGQDNSLYHYVPWNYIKSSTTDGEENGKILKLDTLPIWKYDNTDTTTRYSLDWTKYDIFNQRVIISIVNERRGN